MYDTQYSRTAQIVRLLFMSFCTNSVCVSCKYPFILFQARAVGESSLPRGQVSGVGGRDAEAVVQARGPGDPRSVPRLSDFSRNDQMTSNGKKPFCDDLLAIKIFFLMKNRSVSKKMAAFFFISSKKKCCPLELNIHADTLKNKAIFPSFR
jgi:hypothetical protein